MTRRVVVPDFCDEANAMRAAFDRLVGDPYDQDMTRDGVWNYWYVPGLYTYFRATPERVLPPDVLARFRARLESWALAEYGFSHLSSQTFCMYIDGCELTLHNDASHGDYAFVYSLTNWDTRRFEGGETILFGDKTAGVRGVAAAGVALYERVPMPFNQLLIFDDRLVHGVSRVTGGGMNPLDSRVVITGHLSARDVVVTGVDDETNAIFEELLAPFASTIAELRPATDPAHQGFLTARAKVTPSGELQIVEPLLARVATHDGQLAPVEPELARLSSLLGAVKFPRTPSGATITIPLSFKGEEPGVKSATLPAEKRGLRKLLAPLVRRHPKLADELRVLRLMPPSRKRVPFVRQGEAVECGAASLAMVLAYHGRPVPLAEVREACGVSAFDASSAKDIVVAARFYGLSPRARRLAPKALESVSTPAILHWESDHFVVLERWTAEGAVVVDPREGRRFVSPEAFAASYGGVSIELTTDATAR